MDRESVKAWTLGANPNTHNCGLRVCGAWLLQARWRTEHFAEILHAFCVPVPGLMGWVTIVVELVGGLAVLIGPFVLWVSIPLAAILLVSIFTLLLPYGFLSIKLQAVTSTGIQLGTPGTRSICCILPVWRRWFLSAPGRFRLTCYSPNSRANARRPARLRLRGTHTDKAKGIGELQVPAEKRRLLRPFVKLLLASAELRDQHSLQACELLEELKQESPRNPLYEQELKNLKSKS